jgi:pimeloyl-ACP methyl ester carboxylesterase
MTTNQAIGAAEHLSIGSAGNGTLPIEGKYIRANGADIYYVEAGQGEPLVLLHGGLMSTGPVWDGFPGAYVSHMATFAQHFHVIAPDCRGYGRTVNAGGGSILLSTFADDTAALIDALGLEQPMICGFSEGGMTATIVGIQHPGLVRAIVNDAGYDVFNPNAQMFVMARQLLGGSLDATQADPAAVERSFGSSDQMRVLFALMQADHDGAQGPGYWKTMISKTFERWTQPPNYTFADFGRITGTTLILFCFLD